jgi:hypothetical protein
MYLEKVVALIEGERYIHIWSGEAGIIDSKNT